MINYIFSDLRRSFISWKFMISVMGVVFTFYLLGIRPISSYSIVSSYHYNIFQMQVLLVYIFCIMSYGDNLCQDIECRFYQLLIIRGKTNYYGISKAIVVFLSAVLTMFLGTGMHLLILKIQYPDAPWITKGYEWGGMFDSFILNQKYITHILLCSLQLGFLTGILALVCTLASLYIANRLLTLSLPIISYYILCYVSEIFFGIYSFGYIYDPWYIVWGNEIFSFLIMIFVTIVLFLILTKFIVERLKRRLAHD